MPALKKLEQIGVIIPQKNHGSWTHYALQTSPKNGTTSNPTSPKNGTGQPVPKTVPVQEKPVPKTVLVGQNQSQKRDTKEKNKRIKPKPLSEHLKMAEWIWGRVQPVTNSAKSPDLESWADDIRKLEQLDKRELPLIAEVFNWANRDSFWRTNILSTGKLRQQFDTLYAKQREQAHAANRLTGNSGTAGSKQTPGQRTAAKREALRRREIAEQSPDVGTVATDGRNVWPPVALPAR